jgi:hypothetical protein
MTTHENTRAALLAHNTAVAEACAMLKNVTPHTADLEDADVHGAEATFLFSPYGFDSVTLSFKVKTTWAFDPADEYGRGESAELTNASAYDVKVAMQDDWIDGRDAGLMRVFAEALYVCFLEEEHTKVVEDSAALADDEDYRDYDEYSGDRGLAYGSY